MKNTLINKIILKKLEVEQIENEIIISDGKETSVAFGEVAYPADILDQDKSLITLEIGTKVAYKQYSGIALEKDEVLIEKDHILYIED